MVNHTHQETAAQVNSVGSDTEPLVPRSDILSSPPSAVDPCSYDLPTGQQVDTDSESDMSFIHALSHDGTGIRELQKTDPDTSAVLQWIEGSGSRPPRGHMKGSSQPCWKLWTEYPRLAVKYGVLCRTVKSSRTGGDMSQVVVPSSLVPDLLQHLHGGPASAHFSAERVWEQARQTCYWPSMFKDIQQWCEQCIPCQTRKAPAPKHRAPMGGSQATLPFQRVATDILELLMTSKGNRHVLW